MCGLRNEQTQKQLLSEINLTLGRAVDIFVAVETATKDAVELGQYRYCAAIHKVRCARNGHIPDERRFRDAQCQKCKVKGHI